MRLDEKRWQMKLVRKRKAQARAQSYRSSRAAARAATLPIQDCLATKNLFETGIGMVVLTRALPSGDLLVAAFLVDVFCLGVKNVVYRVAPPQQCAQFVQNFVLETIHPTCLRKLIEGAVEYARALGFAPHPDYAGAARLFGNIEAAMCPVRYTYGKDGKPFYVSGPNDTPAQSRRIIDTLRRQLGEDGYQFASAVASPEAGLDTAVPEPTTLLSYEITREPLPDATFARLPSHVQAQINALHEGVRQPRPRQAVAELRALIEQYPDVPQLHNYLHIAYDKLGEHDEAARVLQETVQRFPDYLFGRLSWAEACLARGEPEKIAEIFEGKFDLRLLYPQRARFHLAEILSFHSIVARYFHALGHREQAQRSYALMCQLSPQHPTTLLVGRTLQRPRFGAWLRDKLRC